MEANQKQELITEIKVAQAELNLLIYINKHYKLSELLEDIDAKNKELERLREAYFLSLD